MNTIVNDQITSRIYLVNDQKVMNRAEESTHNHLNMTILIPYFWRRGRGG